MKNGMLAYKGLSGNFYQYDLSNPIEKAQYQQDIVAQTRDKLSFNPYRSLENGGGIYENIKYLTFSIYTLSLFFTFIFGITSISSVAYAETKMVKVYTEFSDQQLLDIAKKKYKDVELVKKGRIRIISDSGMKLFILNNNNTLTFIAYWGGELSLKDVNKWNAKKRFIRPFIDYDAEVATQFDLDAEGISEEYLLDSLERTFVGLSLFAVEASFK